MSYSIPGVVDSGVESFYYNGDGSKVVGDRANVGEGTLKAMALFSNSWIYYHYDDLSRLSKREVGGILEEHYTYLAGSEAGTTTTLPETYDTTAKGSSTKLSGYRYAYDERNNIVQETDLNTGKYWKYAYDKLGQLQYATEYAANGTGQKRYKYYYDHAGNLTSWRIEDGAATNTQEEHTYTYGDSNWKDLLTAFDGKAITYDANGNPTKYYNGGTMTWRNGRQLASYSLGGKTYRYEYDVNGLRTRKSNADGGYTEYYIIDGLAVAERRYYSGGGEQYTLRYLYDESNNPVGFGMQYPNSTRWTNYYFEKNVQGDVIGVYQREGDGNSATHILAARYSYDPYGNPTSMTNGAGTAVSQTSNTIAAINPFRYRGYRYDGDTGLYYLQSRYYDPVSCRFVNADKYASTGYGTVGFNMFAYCNNNPVSFADQTGDLFGIDDIVAVAAVFIVVVVVAVVTSPPVQTAIDGLAHSLSDALLDVVNAVQDIATMNSSKAKGKEHMRDTGLSGLSDAEVQQGARDKTKSNEERQRYKREEKARGLRNKNRRDEIF